ncbi:hypothetical protein GN958_ATG07964 [Phytophthora infestans]|uniref:Uncharacterized protein n=1 Tax=Phytophthora infestans TaxID=4787 RepID=A0A8S9UUS9_PHYIN|nr:hypothetical protein GN958_ATG07964 [Phytophthora infestans]
MLSDAAFIQEATDFLDKNCFSPSTLLCNVEDSRLSTFLESEEASTRSALKNLPPSDIKADEHDLAIITLTMHRDKEKLRRRKQRQRVKDELEKLRRANDELSSQLRQLKLAKEARRSPSQQRSH